MLTFSGKHIKNNEFMNKFMKNMNKLIKQYLLGVLTISALSLGLFAGATVASANVVPSCDRAILRGTLVPDGTAMDAWFEWGPTSSLGNNTPRNTYYSETQYSYTITGLTPNTNYYTRAVAESTAGRIYGNIENFQTSQCSNPEPTITPVTVSISASPSSIVAGKSSTLSWSSSGATDCYASMGDGAEWSNQGLYPNSSTPVHPSQTTTYKINCSNSTGGRDSASTTVNVTNGGGTTSSGNIQPGNLNYQCLTPTSVRLNWTSGVNANSNSVQKMVNGSWNWLFNSNSTDMSSRTYTDYNFSPNSSYRVKYAPEFPSNVVTPDCGSGPVENQPTVTITADDNNLNYNESTIVRWSSTYATSCSASGGRNGWSGSKSTSGSFPTGLLPANTTYNITCSNNFGSDNDSVTIYVDGQVGGNPPTVSIEADDTNIDYDESTTVRWNSDNADYCTASGGRNSWSGSRKLSGSFFTSSLTSDVTYTITCSNNYGSRSDSVTVNVGDNNNNNEGPDVTTRSATDVDYTSATLNGRVDGNGLSTRAWFEYGTTRSLNESTRERSYGSGSTSYDEDITGLRRNTVYYFRAVAENAEDTVYGNILSFTTDGDYVVEPPVYGNRPTVNITSDLTTVAYNGTTVIRWYTTNASSCYASGGSVGWSGNKSIGPGVFYSGSLTSAKTYTITCTNSYGTATDSVTVGVNGRVLGTTTYRPAPTSYVLITSSVDRNQPIVPTLDNTRPHPGDEINYTVTYQNIGNASITNLTLRVDLPYEVDYLSSNPTNPIRSGQTLIFNLGTLKANGQGTVSIRVRVKDNVAPGTSLNFPATLTYTDPSGYTQSVNANVYAQTWDGGDNTTIINTENNGTVLGANALGAGFFPGSLFEWLILLILILILIVLIKYIFNSSSNNNTHTVVHH